MPRRSIYGAAKVRISESNVKFYSNIAETEYLGEAKDTKYFTELSGMHDIS